MMVMVSGGGGGGGGGATTTAAGGSGSGPGNGSSGSTARQLQLQQRQRQMASLFHGGPANKYLLALRSGIPTELDYALEALVRYSYSDAPFLPLEHLHGLASALLDVIQPVVTAAAAATTTTASCCDAESHRRAVEAALVLRNIVVEGGHKGIQSVRNAADYLFQTLVDLLSLPHTSSLDTEITLYLFDIAQVYAHIFTISHPPTRSDCVDDPLLATHVPHSWTVDQRLYPLLAQTVAHSNDRALIIAAYMMLGALAINDKNHAVLAATPYIDIDIAKGDSQTISGGSSSSTVNPMTQPTLALMARALDLTCLDDADLLLPILEYLYQTTRSALNGVILMRRHDFTGILRMLINRIKEGSSEETVEYKVYSRPDIAPARGKALRTAFAHTYPGLSAPAVQIDYEAPVPKLNDEDVRKILRLAEPERGMQWMKAIYEADSQSEVTQVALWKSYREQWDTYLPLIERDQIPRILTASDIIRLSSEIFPGAAPSVIPDAFAASGKRFVIKGMRVKPAFESQQQQDIFIRNRWRCQWQDCTLQSTSISPLHLYEHLCEAHIANQDSDFSCHFGKCHFVATSAVGLSLHCSTHISATTPASRESLLYPIEAADALDTSQESFTDSRVQAQVNNNDSACGIGFLALLTLRNLARAIAMAASRHSGNPAVRVRRSDTNDAINDEDASTMRFFNFLNGKIGAKETDDDALPVEVLPNVSTKQLQRAIAGLLEISPRLLSLYASNKALVPYLQETLDYVEQVRLDTQNGIS